MKGHILGLAMILSMAIASSAPTGLGASYAEKSGSPPSGLITDRGHGGHHGGGWGSHRGGWDGDRGYSHRGNSFGFYGGYAYPNYYYYNNGYYYNYPGYNEYYYYSNPYQPYRSQSGLYFYFGR